LTGFKWIANRAIDFQKEGKVVLFSFEEAIGELSFSIELSCFQRFFHFLECSNFL
jgi:hypothetical protein